MSLVIAAPPTPRPTLAAPVLSGNSLVLGGSGGPPNGVGSGNNGSTNGTYYYYVLSSTNVAQPLPQWSPLATNPFAAGGNFSFTNLINSNLTQQFFILQVP